MKRKVKFRPFALVSNNTDQTTVEVLTHMTPDQFTEIYTYEDLEDGKPLRLHGNLYTVSRLDFRMFKGELVLTVDIEPYKNENP